MTDKIDWTKPIEWVGLDGEVSPATLIGTYNGMYVVGRCADVKMYSEDGRFRARGQHRLQSHHAWIRNVPPPKIEKTVVVLLFKDGSCLAVQPVSEHGWGKSNIIARREITITEGEGL